MFSGMWTFSADVPYDAAVPAYIRHRGDTRLPMNVSAEADAAYVAEKKLNVGPVTLVSWPVGICMRCHGVIHNAPYLSATGPGRFCSRECRDGAKAESTRKVESTRSRRRTRHYKNCKQCRTRFLPKRTDQEFCEVKCRVSWNRANSEPAELRVTDNCQPPFGSRASIGQNDGVFAV